MYQLASLTSVTLLVILGAVSASEAWVQLPAALVLLYRLFEIFALLGAWLFADTARLHSYRRSVIGFTLNVVEVSAICAGLGRWLQCGGTEWHIWRQFVAVVSLSSEGTASSLWACNAIPATRFILSAALMLLVFATLAGGLIRKEVAAERANKRLQ